MNQPRKQVATKLARLAKTPIADNDDDLSELSPAELRVLMRRLADAEDRTRYLLASFFSPRFALYYMLSDDLWIMNRPKQATLFKRRAAATAIKALLGPNTSLIRCRVDARGGLVVASIEKPKRMRVARAKR
jgi:hypothetical protein